MRVFGNVCVGLGGHNKCTKTGFEMAETFLFLKKGSGWPVVDFFIFFIQLQGSLEPSTAHNLDIHYHRLEDKRKCTFTF